MRTTITLDADTAALVQRAMRERGLTFKEAVNTAIRAGLGRPPAAPAETPTFHMGEPSLPVEKTLQLAGRLEDDELVRKLIARK